MLLAREAESLWIRSRFPLQQSVIEEKTSVTVLSELVENACKVVGTVCQKTMDDRENTKHGLAIH